MSDLLTRYTEDVRNSRVEWLGPNPGIVKTMDIINSEYPLSLITYITEIESDNTLLHELSRSGNVIIEIKSSRMSNKKFKGVVYINDSRPQSIDGLEPISKEDGVYECETSSNTLYLIRKVSNEGHIMRVRYFVRPIKGRLEVTVFLPTAALYEYYSALYNIAREKVGELVLKNILPYSEDVWNFI